jgi:hypothetical protein
MIYDTQNNNKNVMLGITTLIMTLTDVTLRVTIKCDTQHNNTDNANKTAMLCKMTLRLTLKTVTLSRVHSE